MGHFVLLCHCSCYNMEKSIVVLQKHNLKSFKLYLHGECVYVYVSVCLRWWICVCQYVKATVQPEIFFLRRHAHGLF